MEAAGLRSHRLVDRPRRAEDPPELAGRNRAEAPERRIGLLEVRHLALLHHRKLREAILVTQIAHPEPGGFETSAHPWSALPGERDQVTEPRRLVLSAGRGRHGLPRLVVVTPTSIHRHRRRPFRTASVCGACSA